MNQKKLNSLTYTVFVLFRKKKQTSYSSVKIQQVGERSRLAQASIIHIISVKNAIFLLLLTNKSSKWKTNFFYSPLFYF